MPGAAACRCSATIFDRFAALALMATSAQALATAPIPPQNLDAEESVLGAMMLSANAMQFSQTRDYLIVLHEFQGMKRVIPLDGRPHRKGIEPSYYGDSVGHWEGDTLVVVTKNLKRWSLDDYYYTDPRVSDAQRRSRSPSASAKSPTQLRCVMTLDARRS